MNAIVQNPLSAAFATYGPTPRFTTQTASLTLSALSTFMASSTPTTSLTSMTPTNPLTLTTLRPAQSISISLALESFRASYISFQVTDPVYSSIYFSHVATITDDSAFSSMESAYDYLLKWLPGSDDGNGYRSYVTALPTALQKYVGTYASLEHSVASNVLNRETIDFSFAARPTSLQISGSAMRIAPTSISPINQSALIIGSKIGLEVVFQVAVCCVIIGAGLMYGRRRNRRRLEKRDS